MQEGAGAISARRKTHLLDRDLPKDFRHSASATALQDLFAVVLRESECKLPKSRRKHRLRLHTKNSVLSLLLGGVQTGRGRLL